MALCECACGEETTLYRGEARRFISGHNNRGNKKPRSIVLTPCTCGCGELLNIYDSRGRKRRFINGHQARVRRGESRPATVRQAISRGLQGHPVAETTRRKLSAIKRAQGQSPEMMAALCRAQEGRRGTHHSVETRKKISLSHRRRCAELGMQGDKSYPLEFSARLRRQIKTRDGYRCRVSGRTEELGQWLDVHHIDYDKNNNDPSNLITLSKHCHGHVTIGPLWWQNHLTALRRLDEHNSSLIH